MPTKIMACKCHHAYQDRLYGAGLRVFNLAPGNDGRQNNWRCSVCKTLVTEKRIETTKPEKGKA